MKIMRISGGMANNMFQYAAYLQIKKKFPNEEVYVDTMWKDVTLYPYDLEQAFGLDVSEYDFWQKAQKECRLDYENEFRKYRFWEEFGYKSWAEMIDKNYRFLGWVSGIELPMLYQKAGYDFEIALSSGDSLEETHKMMLNGGRVSISNRQSIKKFLYRLLGEHNMIFTYERTLRLPDKRRKFFMDIKNMRKPDFSGAPSTDRFNIEGNVFYCTYGNENDVIGVEEELKEIFTFVPFTEENNNILAKEIQNCESVSIHARVSAMEYGINASLHRNYYKKAVKYIEKKRGKNIKYYIFSDRPQWVKQNIHLLGLDESCNYLIVENNAGEKSYRDMQLMSLCKHNICAQSTFSWWAGFLNRNPNKIVITPYETMPGTISF